MDPGLILLAVVALVCVVAIIAILWGKRFSATVRKDQVNIEAGGEDEQTIKLRTKR